MIEKNKIVYYGKKSKHDNNIVFVNEQNFIGQYYNTQNNVLTLNELRKLESKSVNKKSFPELFSFNEISLWWFLRANNIIDFISNHSGFLTSISKNPQTNITLLYGFK